MAVTAGQNAADRIDLWSKLRFDASSGAVWLGEQRMLLLHARSLGAFRNQLIRSLGEDRAGALLLRMGFDSGAQDALLARTLVGDGTLEDVFLLGPRLHSLEGVVTVEMVSSELDLDTKSFKGRFRWSTSWESETHVEEFGLGDHSTCWNQVGYASGYVSSFLGKPVYFHEDKCRSKGDPHCEIYADTSEPITDTDPVAIALKPDDIVGEIQVLSDELEQLRAYLRQDLEPGALIGRSPAFMSVFNVLKRAAHTPITVLLEGETGVGKEMFARWLHDNSPRRDQPFVAINCGAIPADLVESELFGVESGAFTGAQKSRQGRFERADGGTLFLDEIGEMPLTSQVKLLRALQTGEIERLGDTRARKLDVRIVAATNVDLQEAVKAKTFRSDLFYRLNPYPIHIPPLRERREDIALFVDTFVDRLAKRYAKSIRGVSDKALRALVDYPWPGNIRELENVLERGVLLTQPGCNIDLENLFVGQYARDPRAMSVSETGCVTAPPAPFADPRQLTDLTIANLEAKLIAEALRRSNGNITEAARLLGWTRRQLDYWVKSAAR